MANGTSPDGGHQSRAETTADNATSMPTETTGEGELGRNRVYRGVWRGGFPGGGFAVSATTAPLHLPQYPAESVPQPLLLGHRSGDERLGAGID